MTTTETTHNANTPAMAWKAAGRPKALPAIRRGRNKTGAGRSVPSKPTTAAECTPDSQVTPAPSVPSDNDAHHLQPPANSKAQKRGRKVSAEAQSRRGSDNEKASEPSTSAQPEVLPQPTDPAPAPAGEGKQGQIITLLRRPEGATIAELMAATGWMSHSVRGALSGALKRKLGLAVRSEVEPERGRVYRLGAKPAQTPAATPADPEPIPPPPLPASASKRRSAAVRRRATAGASGEAG